MNDIKINSRLNINNDIKILAKNLNKQEKSNKSDKKKLKKKNKSIFLPDEKDIIIENNINEQKINDLDEFFENFLEEENKKLNKLKPIIHEILKKEEKNANNKILITNAQKFDEEKDDQDNKEDFNWLGIKTDE